MLVDRNLQYICELQMRFSAAKLFVEPNWYSHWEAPNTKMRGTIFGYGEFSVWNENGPKNRRERSWESEKQQHQQRKSLTNRFWAQKVPNTNRVFLCLCRKGFLWVLWATAECDGMRLVTNSTKHKLCRTRKTQRIECEKTFLHIHLSNKEIRKYKTRLSDSSNYNRYCIFHLKHSTISSQVMCVRFAANQQYKCIHEMKKHSKKFSFNAAQYWEHAL